jgi:hypothetical protein
MSPTEFETLRNRLNPEDEVLLATFFDSLQHIFGPGADTAPLLWTASSRNGWHQESFVELANQEGLAGLSWIAEPITYFPPDKVASAFSSLGAFVRENPELAPKGWPTGSERYTVHDDQTPKSFGDFVDGLGQAMRQAIDRGTGFFYLYAWAC